MTAPTVTTQDEFDEAVKAGGWIAVHEGFFTAYDSAQVEASGSAQVRAYGSAQVRAYGSAQVRAYDSAQVEAYGSAQVEAYDSAQVEAYGSAQVEAYGSAQVEASGSAQVQAYDSAQVQAYGSAQVQAYDSAQVQAYDSAQVQAYDSAQVQASKYVAVTIFGGKVHVSEGCTVIEVPDLSSMAAWCDYYGLAVADGLAVVFKGVDDHYRSGHGTAYDPGAQPSCDDWSPEPVCGGGLHFSPRPSATLTYNPTATRWLACPVAVDEAVVITDGYGVPDKIKARQVARPVYEVDLDGDPVPQRVAS